MKVCHLTSVHPHTDTRIFVKECSTLAVAGYETHLISPTVEEESVQNGVHLHTIARSSGGRWKRMTQTVWQVYQQSVRIDADVYQFHDPELIPIGLLLQRRGKKVIYDVHEDVPRQLLSKTWIAKPLRRLISRAFEVLENAAAKRFDAVIAATPFIRNRFERRNPRTVDVNNYPLLQELYLPNVDWSQKQRAVCYVGGISYIRGIREMVEALHHTDAQLLLAGAFEAGVQVDSLYQMPGWSNVEPLGKLDRAGVRQTLAQSMAGLVVLAPVINYIDALPVKMFEYMAAGLPVIASRFPLWQEIVEANQCGLCVDPLDPLAIAEAICSLVDNPMLAKQLGENGRRLVEERCNWEIESQKLLNVYEQLSTNTNPLPLQFAGHAG